MVAEGGESTVGLSDLMRASKFLALGSLLLLVGILSPLYLYYLYTYPVISLALALHGAGWFILGRALGSGLTRWMFRGSVIAFAVGLVTLPFVPAPPVPGAFAWVPFAFLPSGGFAFIPSVFGPVVIAHGFLFLVLSHSMKLELSRVLIAVGSVYLIAVALIALSVQLSLMVYDGVSVFLYSPLTVAGYTLVNLGFRNEFRTHWRPQESVPKPASGG